MTEHHQPTPQSAARMDKAEPVALYRDLTVTVVVDHDTATLTVSANGRTLGAIPLAAPTGKAPTITTLEVCAFNARDYSHASWQTVRSARARQTGADHRLRTSPAQGLGRAAKTTKEEASHAPHQ